MKLPLSVIIHTRNSSKTLEKALRSIAFAQEVIVVDMESADDSVAIAKKHGARVVKHKDVGFVEPARMFGIAQAAQEWVLVLDADEEIQPKLAQKIPELLTQEVSAWKIPRKNLMFGKWPKHAAWWPDYVVRLFKKNAIDWPATIHAQPTVDGRMEELEASEDLAILHQNYDSVTDYVERLNHYTSIAANETKIEKRNALKAFSDELVNKYFHLNGHKDGVVGLHISMLQAMYQSILAMKMWEKLGKKEISLEPGSIIQTLMRDLAYWRADYELKKSKGLGRIVWMLRRKLKV
jgi:(heptosyl)LPS beta-1,4-glucosyltransferase